MGSLESASKQQSKVAPPVNAVPMRWRDVLFVPGETAPETMLPKFPPVEEHSTRIWTGSAMFSCWACVLLHSRVSRPPTSREIPDPSWVALVSHRHVGLWTNQSLSLVLSSELHVSPLGCDGFLRGRIRLPESRPIFPPACLWRPSSRFLVLASLASCWWYTSRATWHLSNFALGRTQGRGGRSSLNSGWPLIGGTTAWGKRSLSGPRMRWAAGLS